MDLFESVGRHLLSSEAPKVKDIHEDFPKWAMAQNIVGAIFVVLTWAVTHPHTKKHLAKGREEAKITVFMPGYRSCILLLLWMPNFFSLSAWIAVFAPATIHVMELIRNLYEAACLVAFFFLVLDFLGGPAHALKVCSSGAPRRYYALPPCCCLYPCLKPTVLTTGALNVCYWCVLQFIVMKPAVYIIQLGIDYIGGDYEDSAIYFYLFNLVQTAMATYGLFILYFCVREPIAHYNIGKKFVLIKIIIALAAVQGIILTGAIPEQPEHSLFSRETKGEMWNNFLIILESFFIAVFMRSAFPVDECDNLYHEHIALLYKQKRLTTDKEPIVV
eukprot:TRINITY_DN2386_c0_g4::TRINITY_DN2386_c0_g4_i1::g.20703::m.20703 TRINITY_DN2386_c0_g4::TRINITY_DN2386_c0_g4_i1::g.20703  ORF type:complete len:331 (-),score=70.31,sp/Q9Y519/T184B_HUMAN/28.40/4e-16,Solute_trans_a/PF03619.11/3.2e-30 TRINITY_DN2386_c0_g4_i1:375-1367(-)